MNTTKDSRDTQSLFGLESAAAVLGNVSVWTLRKHCSRGNIKVTRIGRRVLLSSEEIERIRREGLPSLRVEPGRDVISATNPNSHQENQ